LSADDRFFPSTSFVVDPPALPEGFQPDVLTSKQLHFEKVLQFVGLADTAKEYVTALSWKLRASRLSSEGEIPSRITTRIERQLELLSTHFGAEKERVGLRSLQIGDATFVGRHVVQSQAVVKAFLGVSESALNAGVQFGETSRRIETRVSESDGVYTSVFGDGTVLQLIAPNSK
jgi:hypothetical protein